MLKHICVISWLASNNGKMVIYAFLLGFSSPSYKKKVIRVLRTRDHLILLITNKNHKTHLFSCAWRCSSKLQEIQNLENFVLMAIQGTQVPMYTNTHCFCIFLIFLFLFWKTNKIKTEQPNKNKQTTWKHERKMHMHEGMIERCRRMKAWFQKQIRNQAKRVLL